MRQGAPRYKNLRYEFDYVGFAHAVERAFFEMEIRPAAACREIGLAHRAFCELKIGYGCHSKILLNLAAYSGVNLMDFVRDVGKDSALANPTEPRSYAEALVVIQALRAQLAKHTE
jgi:hypothetical protein